MYAFVKAIFYNYASMFKIYIIYTYVCRIGANSLAKCLVARPNNVESAGATTWTPPSTRINSVRMKMNF